MRILVSNGINWTWYMHLVTHKDGTCTVVREYRLHNYGGAEHPRPVGSYGVVEHESKREEGETFPPRIATAITVEDGKRRTRTYPLRGGPVLRFSFPK